MSTYEELSLIVSVALLIVTILNYTHKKQPVLTLQKSTSYFQQFFFSPGWGSGGSLPAFLLSILYVRLDYLSNTKNRPVLLIPNGLIYIRRYTRVFSRYTVSASEQPCNRNIFSMAVIFVPNFLKIQRKEDEYVDGRYLKSRGQKGDFSVP